jgi:hypothetical protein
MSEGIQIKVTLSATARDQPSVDALIDSAQADLQRTLAALGLGSKVQEK